MNGKKRLQKLRLNHFLSGWLWLLLAFGTGLLLLRGSYGPPAWQTFWQPTFFQLIKGDHFFDSQTIWVDLADHALTKEEQSSINQLAQSKRSVAFYSVEMMPGVSRNPNKTQEEALKNSGLIRYIEPISLSFVDSGFVGQLIPTQQQAYLPPRYRLLSHDAGENSIELTTTLHLTTMIKRNNATEWQDVINSVQAIRPAEPVWVMHAAEEPRVVSLSEFLSQQVPENTAQVVFFNSQQSGTLVEDVESLLAGLYAVDLPYYLIGMLGLIVLGVIFFTVSLRLTLSTTTLLIITAIALQWALQWWLLKTFQWWLPTFESSLLLVLAGVLGWLEKMHQKPLGQWLVTRQVWGRHSAESLAEQHQYTQAFDTLKQLQADQHVKSQAYKLAQACERKRDFALAGDIYLWLNQFGKGYEDSRERAEKLAKVTKATTSLVGTIALDQTLLMPGEDL